MILSRSQCTFCGPAKEMVNYFTALGYPCPPYTNPLDEYGKLNSSSIKSEMQHAVLVDLFTLCYCSVKMKQTLAQRFESLQRQANFYLAFWIVTLSTLAFAFAWLLSAIPCAFWFYLLCVVIIIAMRCVRSDYNLCALWIKSLLWL